MARRQAVLSFLGGLQDSRSVAVRGGKGMSLAEMADLGLPVPPGFTLSTGVSRAYLEHGRFPERVFAQVNREIERLEKITGRTFGDPDYPLLVSVRSGAVQSMPGMMDTILNVGLDPKNIDSLANWGDRRFARDTRDRFLSQWKEINPSGFYPLDAYSQLWAAITAVVQSWNSQRAKAYRAAQGIPHHLGTAVTVQAMVFGNIDQQSCTGVVFSANVATGERGLYGEFLPRAQGEDVVSGVRTPRPIADMKIWNPELYGQLNGYVRALEAHCSDVVDVEFTVEKSVLYILQYRKAKRSPLAQVKWVVDDVWKKCSTKQQALERVSGSEVRALRKPSFSQHTIDSASVMARGLPASPGASTGVVALSSERAQQFTEKGWPVVLVREDTSPGDLPGMLVSKAIVTANGGATSHAAVVARELGLPAVVGAGLSISHLTEGEYVSVDGSRGLVLQSRLPTEEVPACKEVNIFLRWWDAANSYTPRIGFEWVGERLSANVHLNDFYLTEMMERVCIDTPLENKARALRSAVHRRIGESLALYLLMIIAGEARNFHCFAPRITVQNFAALKRADAVVNSSQFAVQASAHHRHGMHAAVASTLASASEQVLLGYVTDIREVLESDVWQGSSYGGKAWVAIADALLKFLKNELTLSLFVDHVFDLAHNGGRLFNKNPLFSLRTREDIRGYGGVLELQLDIKKAVSDPSQLYQKLSRHTQPSPEVVEMWGLVRNMLM